eukprot:1159553-Pelagomonas_calceolata.AAC.14
MHISSNATTTAYLSDEGFQDNKKLNMRPSSSCPCSLRTRNVQHTHAPASAHTHTHAHTHARVHTHTHARTHVRTHPRKCRHMSADAHARTWTALRCWETTGSELLKWSWCKLLTEIASSLRFVLKISNSLTLSFGPITLNALQAGISHEPISQTTWLKVAPHCNHGLEAHHIGGPTKITRVLPETRVLQALKVQCRKCNSHTQWAKASFAS